MSKQLALLRQPQVRHACIWYAGMVSLALLKYWSII